MSTPPTDSGLTEVEMQALDVAADVYRAVSHSRALDSRDHWERFANRLASAAYAQTGATYMEQVSRRFGVRHTPGAALTALLSATPSRQREVLRTIRAESNALSVLVRDRRDQERRGND